MIAPPIGYPIAYPIGFVSGKASGLDRPTPYPIPDPGFEVISSSLFLISHPSPKRSVTRSAASSRLDLEC